jgi:hypothetical protein
VPSHRPGWPLETLATLVVALVVLTIVKPWDAPPAAAPLIPLQPQRSEVGPAATQDRSAEGIAEPVCLGTAGWRLATIERWRLVIAGAIEIQKVSVWRAMTPLGGSSEAEAPTDPTDSRIPIIAVAGEEIDAVGWCAPADGPAKPIGPADVTLWRVDPAGPVVAPVHRILPASGTTQFAALYAGVADCSGSPACPGSQGGPLVAPSWTAGRYVFRYVDRGAGQAWWFGADIQVLAAPTAPPAAPATERGSPPPP